MSTTSAADGTAIHYASDGPQDAPAVMLVHGITESSESWATVLPLLTADHHVVTLDLRGHGRSGLADTYDLGAMAGDVIAVAGAAGLDRPHLVGHSLGGAVVSAVGAVFPVSSVVNVDQSLQLGGFKAQLMEFEPQLRDPDTFGGVIQAIFASMAGEKIAAEEMARINGLRQPKQAVVLGVWEMILSSSEEEVDAVVEEALAGYEGVDVPYLSLFGIDPGEGYGEWLASHIDGAVTEVWPDHGHYPHLVDPERFVDRLRSFWS